MRSGNPREVEEELVECCNLLARYLADKVDWIQMNQDSGFGIQDLDSSDTSSPVVWDEFSLVSPEYVDRTVREVAGSGQLPRKGSKGASLLAVATKSSELVLGRKGLREMKCPTKVRST